MTGFSRDWLRLRESADLAARDPGLARRFAAALPREAGRAVRLVDLGAGTGANCRALMPRIAGDQDWLLIEHDPALIAAQLDEMTAWARRQGYPILAGGGQMTIDAGIARWRLKAHAVDLARDGEALEGLEADGVAAAAFFDLVSTEWLERFVAWLCARELPLLAALTVDGRRHWEPALDADNRMAAGFRLHQTGDKGFGPALGGAAPEALARALAERGFAVAEIRSDWHLGARDRALIVDLLAGEREAAAAAAPADAAACADWAARRRELLDDAKLTVTIGHRDILALPQWAAKMPAHERGGG